jgi:hypothetical protein
MMSEIAWLRQLSLSTFGEANKSRPYIERLYCLSRMHV